MAQFGTTTKNPPWARTQAVPAQAIPAGAVNQPGHLAQQVLQQNSMAAPGLGTNATMVQFQQAAAPAAQQVFQPAIGLQQAGMALPTSLAATIGTPGVALPTSLATTQVPVGLSQVATVSYPTPRLLQPGTFQQPAPPVGLPAAAVPVQTPVPGPGPGPGPGPAPGPGPGPSAQQQPPKQRVFTGTVTKLHDNFGFVDEDVFFQTSCVKGHMPKVSDRVLVEASFNQNMPFKWNAARIQVLPNQSASQRGGPGPALVGQGFPTQNSFGGGPVPCDDAPGGRWGQPGPVGPGGPGFPSNSYNAVPPPDQSGNYMRPGVGPNRRVSPPGRVRERERERVERDQERERRREDRIRDRDREREKERRSPTVRKRSRSPRARSRTPPRRRARIVPRYMVQIPKISLDVCEANVMELRKRYTNLYIPSDFFSSYFAWVKAFPANRPFSLDHACAFHIMHKEVDEVLENDAVLEPPDADHLFSAKVMLISTTSREDMYHKTCGLAEDSLEMRESFVHPTRLLHFLVGLRGKNETTAVGGPWSPSLDGANPEKDPRVLIKTAIRTCKALTGIDLSSCTHWYRFVEIYYRRGESTHRGRTVPARVETTVIFLPDVWSCLPTRLEWDGLHLNYKKQLTRKQRQDETANEEEKEEAGEEPVEKNDPTHHSELDPKGMKVTELRQELEARTLNSKGLKSQLIARLTKAIKVEAEEEEEESKETEQQEEKMEVDEKEEEKKRKEEEEKKKQDEREKIARERRYTLPDAPHIIVHPSRTAKSGKFDCTVMSLSVLLDYRQEDNKEHSFEVSLFAELFNEMLMRDFGFQIYCALVEAPERPKEEKEEKEKKKEKDKKDEKKEEKKEDKREEKSEEKEKVKEKSEERRDEKEKSEEKEDEAEAEEDEEDEVVREITDDEDSRDKDKEKKDKDKDRDKKREKVKKKEKVKMYTSNCELLLSFIYFDQSHCGYVFDKDVEEILYTLGLSLSRAQVRKLVQKVVTRDTLNYRKLTDKPKVKEGEEEKYTKEEKPEDGKDANIKISLEELAVGNRSLLPVFGGMEDGPAAKRPKLEKTEDGESPDNTQEGLVMYKGSLLDIEKLLQQLHRSEKARADTEEKMKDMTEELDELHAAANASANTTQAISMELRDYKKRLKATEDEMKKVKVSSGRYMETLRMIHEKVGLHICTEESEKSESGGKEVISNGVKSEVKTEPSD